MTGRVSNGMIHVLFKEWIVPHSKAMAAMEYMNELRVAKRHSRWDTEATGAHLLAPSHCGKSHIINKMYFSRFILPELRQSGEYGPDVPDSVIKRLQKKFLYLKVPSKPTLGDFGTSFLVALDDPFPSKKENVLDRIRRAEDIMGGFGTELIALDNFDQLTKKADRQSMKEASQVQDVVKTMLEHGFPIVFTGLYNAKEVILQNMQLKNRVKGLNIMPLRLEKDAEELYRFLAGLELLMLEHKIFDEPTGLCEEYVVLRLYYSSQGRIGILANIVRDAAKLASTERCKRIELRHISIAVDEYPVANKICRYNPFSVRSDHIIEQDCKTRVAADEQYYGKEYMEYFQ
ncbi:TniB family NTP-binding protein [Rhizobium gallicum]|uniref:TniB family NTP-binding protein n=1 Tax=Rhizobium gallicum TaxID=56730 RepID=UPI001EF78232|nr:TniB family NTP-binding protein [Rhizobium gallicum]ULJ73014.1 TniB family NTP-binding protein [Rhizobium gallicum]